MKGEGDKSNCVATKSGTDKVLAIMEGATEKRRGV